MPAVLSIESSTTKVGSLAFHSDGELLAYRECQVERSHSEVLGVALNDMLAELRISSKDLDAVAVSKGPGSYTGLRIGVSLAKGLCYAHQIKLMGVGTLQSMALEVKQRNLPPGYLCPMIDARRMEVYCQVFNEHLDELSQVQSVIVDEDAFSEYRDQTLYLFGDGAEKCRSVIRHPNVVYIEDIHPNAKHIGLLATRSLEVGIFENLAYFEPYYLKEFIAKKPSGKNLV